VAAALPVWGRNCADAQHSLGTMAWCGMSPLGSGFGSVDEGLGLAHDAVFGHNVT